MSKIDEYSRKDVVKKYDSWRFGGKSGEYVDKREKAIVEDFLADSEGPILDVACGTGRFVEMIACQGKKVFGADYSLEMLKRAKKRMNVDFVRCDINYLPFKTSSFGAINSGRLFQHYKNIAPLVKEMRRVTKHDGRIVFDALLWSPRMIHSFIFRDDVRGIFPHFPKEIKNISDGMNLEVEELKSCFLISPGIYRFLPFQLVKILDRLETLSCGRLGVRIFYKLRRL